MGYVVLVGLLLAGMIGLQAREPELFQGLPILVVGLLGLAALVGLVRGRRR
jgi:hypothetical protein